MAGEHKKKIHCFFIESPLDSIKVGGFGIGLDANLLHQFKNVLRFHKGERVIFFDNSGWQYLVELVSLDKKDEIKFLLIDKKCVDVTTNRKIILFMSLIKKDKFEEAIQKACEIGVSQIVPLLADRSASKTFNEERVKKIIKEACEQSERPIMPKINKVVDINNAFKIVDEEKITPILFSSEFEKISSEDLKKYNGKDIGIFIGPEGGWSIDEFNLFKNKNVRGYSLGNGVLRAETAVNVSLTCFMLF